MSRMEVIPQAALDVTREFFNAVKTHLECPHCDLLVIDDQKMLWSHHSSGWFVHMRGLGIKSGSGLSWIAFQQGGIQIFHNPGSHPQVIDPLAHLAPQGVQASAPIFNRGEQPLAVIHVLRSASHPFMPHELTWLEERCQEVRPRLEAALQSDAGLERGIMQQSSPRTQALMDRTFAFTTYLGESPIYAKAVAMGAMLLENELCLEALRHLPMPLETRDVLEYRHTRFDGTGQPSLPGPRVPMSARIALVCAAFEQHFETDSDPQHALALLRREAGWRLDPLLVKALEQHLQTAQGTSNKKLEPFDSSLVS
jgi:hypothetical protein